MLENGQNEYDFNWYTIWNNHYPIDWTKTCIKAGWSLLSTVIKVASVSPFVSRALCPNPKSQSK